jgi:hypothetical protein
MINNQDAATGLMGVGALTGAFSAISNAYAQSQAIRAQAAYQATIAKINAQLSEMNADDALRRGNVQARDYETQVANMLSEQRVAYAAQNVDITFGSPMDVQKETRLRGALDVLTIKNNAWREAWGYKNEALQSTFEGRYARITGEGQSRTTLLTGGMQAIGSLTQGAAKIADRYPGQFQNNSGSRASASTSTTIRG